ncbi:MAG: thermonuclease family protein [Mesorhizobium sp.]|nr:MAG: thermonuclease family protein [Mesorhizobium sp.]
MMIAVASLELLVGILLLVKAATLFPVERTVTDPAPDVSDDVAQHPVRLIVNSARKIAEDLIAPPQIEGSGVERVEPRLPLGDLGLASQPKPSMPKDWRETPLYRPVATSSAGFESMGRKLFISGTQSVEADRICLFHESAWPCGQRARAAFNNWMRGRALNCFVPPVVDRFPVAATCRLGKQDVGAWLVSNGWALAMPSGIYGKAEATARTAEMGIFGPP